MIIHPTYEDTLPGNITYSWVPTEHQSSQLEEFYTSIDAAITRGPGSPGFWSIIDIICLRLGLWGNSPTVYMYKQRINDYLRIQIGE